METKNTANYRTPMSYREELLELINEPDDKDGVTHEEFLQATARWRTSEF